MTDRAALTDRLLAECLAAPFRDPALFHKATVFVDDEQVKVYVRERSEAIRDDLFSTPAEMQFAIDRAEQISEIAKLDQSGRERTKKRIVSVLSSHARRLLQHNGHEMMLYVDISEPGREILRWRFLTLALPAGILMAAATPNGFNPSSIVRLLHPSIAPDSPVAHHHIHHASILSFEDLWASLRLRALLPSDGLADSLRKKRAFCPGLHPGFCVGGRKPDEKERAKKYEAEREQHMREWGDLIRQAFIAGRLLERHLNHGESLAKCRECQPILRSTLTAFMAGKTRRYDETPTAFPRSWFDELIKLKREKEESAIERGRDKTRGKSVRRQVSRELSFLTNAFAHLTPEEPESPDLDYERLFVQYLRVKTAIFGLIVHPLGEHGLEKFLEHFSQIKVYAPDSQLLLPPEPVEPGLQVVAAEYRIAPDAWYNTFCRYEDQIKEDLESFLGLREFAWLIHFKRSERDASQPIHRTSIRTMEWEVTRIARILESNPAYLRTLRGIDICGVEEHQPLWVSAESLLRMRERSRIVCSKNPELCLEPLRLTVHSGEDFRWLTSGTRAVAEPFQWKLIQRGDRIGHGIALTLDPQLWWERHEGQVIRVKRFDRLLDLGFLAEYAKNRTAKQEEWLRKEIEKIAKELWPDSTIRASSNFVETAKKLWLNIGGRLTRRLLEMEQLNYQAPSHHRWLHNYLWNKKTQKKAEELLFFPVENRGKPDGIGSQQNERNLLMKARARLITEVARWQVCIESNPSSNLVIASLDAMASQDFLQQRPTTISKPGMETLTWSISTDNPITFSTTLADEYAYAWAGMVLRENNGYDPSHARGLLDDAAATSMRMRFTIPHRDLRPERKRLREQ